LLPSSEQYRLETGTMPGEMNLSGRVEKFMDLDRSPGCSVVYAQPHKVTEWRPFRKNQGNPSQYDKSHMNRLDIAVQHAMEAKQNERLKAFSDKARSTDDTWSRNTSGPQIFDATLGWVPGLDVPCLGKSSRSFSSPSMTSTTPFFHQRSCPSSPSDAVLRARLAAGQTCHMPGYRGFVPGFASETHSVASRFAVATQRTFDAKQADRSGFLDGFERKTWGVTPFMG